METTKEKTIRRSLIEKTCYGANFIYLLFRIFYLILFIIAQIDVLIYISIASLALYLIFFLVIRAKKYYLYALLCGNEFLAIIIVYTLFLGFDTGFFLNLIGLCVVSFFTSYFSKTKNAGKSMIWVVLSVIICLALYFVTSFIEPFYETEKWIIMSLSVAHILAVFALISVYLIIFLRYAFKLENRIINESRTDELTKISNRYGLYDHIDTLQNKDEYNLAIFDIDDFKDINDTYGHVFGDFVLKKVAEIATNTLSDSFICRYGGEEFIVIFKTDNEIEAFKKLDSFRKIISETSFEFDNKATSLTITIGISSNDKPSDIEKWIEMADKKLYLGKNTGKNKTVI